MNSALSSGSIETRVILEPSERGKWLSWKYLKPMITNDGFPVVLYTWRINFCILFHRMSQCGTSLLLRREENTALEVRWKGIQFHTSLTMTSCESQGSPMLLTGQWLRLSPYPEQAHLRPSTWSFSSRDATLPFLPCVQESSGHLVVLRPESVLPLAQLFPPTTEKNAGSLEHSMLTTCVYKALPTFVEGRVGVIFALL